MKCKKAFKNFSYSSCEIEEIQDFLVEKKIGNFVDIEFPPTMKSIHDPDEPYPFKEPIVWKRAKDFMASDADNPPNVFEKEIEPSDIK